MDNKINYVLRNLNPIEAKDIVPILVKNGFDMQSANRLVKYLEENELAEIDYSNEFKFISVPESPGKVQLENLYIRAKITVQGKKYLKEHTSLREDLWYKYKIYFFFTLPILLIGVLIKDNWKSGLELEDVAGLNFTVFVHGPEGIDDLILKNQGKVVLDLKSDRKVASINEKGEATFKGIPTYFNNKRVKIFIEHSQPYRPAFLDSLYMISNGEAINLQVKLYNTDNLYGNVIDSQTGKGVDSVRVSIRDAHAFTDNHGYYQLEIPLKYQKKFQNVRFEKAGYDIVQKNNIPVHTEQSMDISIQKLSEQ